jgi:F-type H+-transporting ATPase subunit gamma
VSERRHEIQDRLATMNELEEVLGAMRGMAAARIQQGERAQAAARAYAERVGAALAELTGPVPAPADAASVVVAICTDRGFVGALNEHVLDAARDTAAGTWIVVGARGMSLAQERRLDARARLVDGGAMASHLGGLGDVADRIAARLAREPAREVVADVVHPWRGPSGAVGVRRARLLPLELPPAAPAAFAPITTQPPAALAAEIGGEVVHARLFEMVAESFAAASAASLEVLQAAHAHLGDMLADLRRSENVLRQEEITAEVLEVITGRLGTGR